LADECRIRDEQKRIREQALTKQLNYWKGEYERERDQRHDLAQQCDSSGDDIERKRKQISQRDELLKSAWRKISQLSDDLDSYKQELDFYQEHDRNQGGEEMVNKALRRRELRNDSTILGDVADNVEQTIRQLQLVKRDVIGIQESAE
jgi:chromosome segregation ATPase